MRSQLKGALQSVGRSATGSIRRAAGAEHLAAWAIESSSDPVRTVQDLHQGVSPYVDHAPAEILGSYVRGYMLIGRAGPPATPLSLHLGARAVIDAASARVPRRIRTYVNTSDLVCDASVPLEPVIRACAERETTWLVEPVIDAWLRAEQAGLTATWTARRGDDLVGGMWGISVGTTYGLVSMFHREDGAGGVAMASLLAQLDQRWDLIDCGKMKPHFSRFGAYEIPSNDFSARVVSGIVGAREPELSGGGLSASHQPES